MRRSSAPCLRLFIPLAAGIWVRQTCPSPPGLSATEAVLSAGLLFISFTRNSFFLFRLRWLYGIALHVLLYNLGSWLLIAGSELPKINALSLAAKKTTHIARVREIVKTVHGYRGELLLTHHMERGKAVYGEALVRAYFSSEFGQLPASGDLIAFRDQLKAIRNKTDSSAFDLERSCAEKGEYLTIFFRKPPLILPGQKKDPGAYGLLRSIRTGVVATIRRFVPGVEEAGLLEALMIGYSNDVGRPLMNLYANTGLAHIIAISGLHLVLIFSLLQIGLGLLGNRLAGKIIRTVVLLGAAWLFAFTTGAGASVLRAAAMLTLPVAARHFFRSVSSVNSAFASGILLLAFNPLWLWNVGFQLSYLAVLGLILFAGPIRALISPRNGILSGLWGSASVSLAAQVLTLPLCLYYFHRFPPYFLISNIVAVPLSSLILGAGIGVCCMGFLPSVAHPAGIATAWLISVMNRFARYMDGLPFASLDKLAISQVRCMLLYGIIAALAWWLMRRRPSALILAGAIITSFILAG